jgi:hypothetical protein
MAKCTGAQAASGPTLVTGDTSRGVTVPAAATTLLMDLVWLHGCYWHGCSRCTVCLAGWLMGIVIKVPRFGAAPLTHAAADWDVHGCMHESKPQHTQTCKSDILEVAAGLAVHLPLTVFCWSPLLAAALLAKLLQTLRHTTSTFAALQGCLYTLKSRRWMLHRFKHTLLPWVAVTIRRAGGLQLP